MTDVLKATYASQAYSLEGERLACRTKLADDVTVTSEGVEQLAQKAELMDSMLNMTSRESTSMFADAYLAGAYNPLQSRLMIALLVLTAKALLLNPLVI